MDERESGRETDIGAAILSPPDEEPHMRAAGTAEPEQNRRQHVEECNVLFYAMSIANDFSLCQEEVLAC